jgi:pyruvate-formate lyase-activating enzyme
MDTEDPKGLVLNIQHFCTDDGPGIRTTVFLKGCSLRCKWCCTPKASTANPNSPTTAATNRVRVRMLGICRQGLTCMTASRAGKRALVTLAIRRPQPAARSI